jgi:hypothetical protein
MMVQRGFVLLITLVVMTVLLSISLSISTILFGELVITEDVGASFVALHAVDTGVERTLYRDRVRSDCTPANNYCSKGFTQSPHNPLPGGACYRVQATGPTNGCPSLRCITVTGQDTCSNAQKFVQRRFFISY